MAILLLLKEKKPLVRCIFCELKSKRYESGRKSVSDICFHRKMKKVRLWICSIREMKREEVGRR